MLAKFMIAGLILITAYFWLGKRKSAAKKTAELVQCDNCGTFIDMEEVREKDGKFLCKECRK